MTTAHIMFGGNIGDVDKTFRDAEEFLSRNGVVFEKRSRIGSSAPVDCVPGTPDFKDQAFVISWNRSAEELLELLQHTERLFGRPENHRSDMSRTLDCDIIFFGNEVINTPRLTIPHPRMHQREFVLELMVETAPDFIHPVLQKSVKEVFDNLV